MKKFDEIIDVAERILEADGYGAITMRRIAEELRIKAPSLYKHVTSKDDILVALQERALVGMGDALNIPGASLTEIAVTYRTFALKHPRLYKLTTSRPLERDRLTPGIEDRAALPLMQATHGDINLARALWAIAHGLVDLEISGRFPRDADIDAVWHTAVVTFENKLKEKSDGYTA